MCRYCAQPGAEGEDGRVHLVPAERADRQVIDDYAVCDAIAGLPAQNEVRHCSDRFAPTAPIHEAHH